MLAGSSFLLLVRIIAVWSLVFLVGFMYVFWLHVVFNRLLFFVALSCFVVRVTLPVLYVAVCVGFAGCFLSLLSLRLVLFP